MWDAARTPAIFALTTESKEEKKNINCSPRSLHSCGYFTSLVSAHINKYVVEIGQEQRRCVLNIAEDQAVSTYLPVDFVTAVFFFVALIRLASVANAHNERQTKGGPEKKQHTHTKKGTTLPLIMVFFLHSFVGRLSDVVEGTSAHSHSHRMPATVLTQYTTHNRTTTAEPKKKTCCTW